MRVLRRRARESRHRRRRRATGNRRVRRARATSIGRRRRRAVPVAHDQNDFPGVVHGFRLQGQRRELLRGGKLVRRRRAEAKSWDSHHAVFDLHGNRQARRRRHGRRRDSRTLAVSTAG